MFKTYESFANCSEEMLSSNIRYYSYDINGQKTLFIYKKEKPMWDYDNIYCILSNENVSMARFGQETFDKICRICSQMSIVIDITNN